MDMNRRQWIRSGLSSWSLLPTLINPSGRRENPRSPQVHLLFGVDYYPDQTPERLWREDASEMAAMGVTNVRIAEFAWALLEPEQGKFDFTWLHRAIDLLHSHEIAVILRTPSAAPPPWLTQKYPEVLMVNDRGMPLSPGTRRFTCPTNKTYRRLSLAITTEMAQAFASTPGVIGWQIDNELTLGDSARCYCRFCRQGFQEWLRGKYGTLQNLNEAWGTVFWSQTYTSFEQIPVPLPSGAPPNPGLALDYDRYQSHANVTFLQDQLTVLRKLCPAHFVTTNNVSLTNTINFRDLYRNLDFFSGDNYPGFFATQMANSDSGLSASPEMLAAVIAFSHDYSRSIKDGKPFFIMEEQTGKAGQPTFSPQPEPGQLRLWSFQAIAHGAMGINYFRWDTATFGAEEYWHGLLNHDRSRSPGFGEVQRTIRAMKSLGPDLLDAPYVADLALCVDLNSDWALTTQPGQPKLNSYLMDVLPWYGSIASANAGIDIVDLTNDLSRYKIVFAPLMYVVSQQQADRIRHFVQNGGTFVAGFRLGVKDENSRIVKTALPGALRDVMGVTVQDYQPIYSQKQGVRFTGLLAGPDADCHIWADILDAGQTNILATYTGAPYVGKPAITLSRFGNGKAIYLGPHLESPDLARVLLTLVGASGVTSGFQVPRGVEVTKRQSGQRTIIYVLNHTAAPQTLKGLGTGKDLLTNDNYSGAVHLDPYGARVLQPS